MPVRALLSVSALVAAASCATAPTYGELASAGALKVSEVGDGVLVEATGRSGMKIEQLLDYALLSAAHAANEQGRDSFLVADLQSWNERVVDQGLSSGYVSGDAGVASAAASPMPGARTPKVRLHAAFSGFGQSPSGASTPYVGSAYVTDTVIEELSARYELAPAESGS